MSSASTARSTSASDPSAQGTATVLAPDGSPERRVRPILVVGLGNPVRGDDGVGWRVVEALDHRLDTQAATERTVAPELDWLAVGGLTLMERLVGYERVILVDALQEGVAPGTVTCRPFDELSSRKAADLDSTHDADLATALATGRALGALLPSEITVVGVEVRDADAFTDVLSPAVETAVPSAVELLLALLVPAGEEVRPASS
jgi:hydrogenase maturation protease